MQVCHKNVSYANFYLLKFGLAVAVGDGIRKKDNPDELSLLVAERGLITFFLHLLVFCLYVCYAYAKMRHHIIFVPFPYREALGLQNGYRNRPT